VDLPFDSLWQVDSASQVRGNNGSMLIPPPTPTSADLIGSEAQNLLA
jgi:hypothetical protein